MFHLNKRKNYIYIYMCRVLYVIKFWLWMKENKIFREKYRVSKWSLVFRQTRRYFFESHVTNYRNVIANIYTEERKVELSSNSFLIIFG